MKPANKQVHVVDATIRDGGYILNHHFGVEDIAVVVEGLDRAGVSFIEVGHGVGVGCHLFRDDRARPKAMPRVGDRQHIETAKGVARNAKVGVVITAGSRFVPETYVDDIADMGAEFVRFAVMPEDVRDISGYVERAVRGGMTVSVNLMQTYALTPEQVADAARSLEDVGCSWFYVVDSAGGMTPARVSRYVGELASATGMRIGLHAHNNMGMAVANGLAAIESGASLVDGNSQRHRSSYRKPRDRTVGAGDARIWATRLMSMSTPSARFPTLPRRWQAPNGNNPVNFISGAAQIHSRNGRQVVQVARQRDVGPGELLLNMGKRVQEAGCLTAFEYPEDLYSAAVGEMKRDVRAEVGNSVVDVFARRSEELAGGELQQAFDMLLLTSQRRSKPRVVQFVGDLGPDVAPVTYWESRGYVGAVVDVSKLTSSDCVAATRPEWCLADRELEVPFDMPVQLKFSTGALVAEAALCQLLVETAGARASTIWVPDSEREIMGTELALAGIHGVELTVAASRPEGCNILFVRGDGEQPWVQQTTGDDVVVFATCDVAPSLVDKLVSRGATVVKPDIGAACASFAQRVVPVLADSTAKPAWALYDPVCAVVAGARAEGSLSHSEWARRQLHNLLTLDNQE